MSDAVGAAGPAEPAPVSTEESPLPLVLFERNLAPVRRVAAYGSQHPESTRFVEVNVRRWLEPLLETDLPEPIRAPLILLAGQIAGIDALDGDQRQERFRTMRQELVRLDSVLGLPLPRQDRPRRKPRRAVERAAPEAPPAESQAPAEQSSRTERTERSSGRRGRRGRSRNERSEAPRQKTTAPEPTPAPERKQPKRPFWNGNPTLALAELEIDADLVERLASHNLRTVHDLLVHRPVAERIHKPIHGAGRELPEEEIAVGGRLAGLHSVLGPDGTRTVQATLKGAGRMKLAWAEVADAERFADNVEIGQRVVVVGTWNGERLENAAGVVEDGKQVRQVQYGLDGVSDAELQDLFFKLLPGFGDLRDPLPNTLRPQDLPGRGQALLALHARGDRTAAERRLAFDEALGLSLGGCWPRFSQRQKGIQQSVLHTAPSVMLSGLDLTLSDAAELAFDELKRDLRRNRPMRRLLAGTPGAGKGLVALLASAAVAEGKVQVLWLTPDDQLAEAHYTYASELLEPTGLKAEFLAPGRKPDRQLLDRLKRGETHVLFATFGQLEHDLPFRRLGLVVLHDHEQAPTVLGKLEHLGPPNPDILVVARQRPTTVSLLTDWASWSLSWLEGPALPDWTVKTVSQRDAAYAPARHAIHSGNQCAVLFPQVAGKDALDPSEASRVMAALSSDALGGAKLALLHGAMPRADRVRTVEDLAHRRVDGVVSTLPLEDLPPLPGIEVAIIEHAHRVGAERLARITGMGIHQLSLVVPDDVNEAARKRLETVLAGTRAPEDVSSVPSVRFLVPERDRDLVLRARAAALEVLHVDTGLRNGAHADLLRLVQANWPVWTGDEECPLPQPGDSGRRRRRRRRRR